METHMLYEYLGIIKPDELVISHTTEMKKRCKNEYGWDSAVRSKPHITICTFVQLARYEERLTKCFERNTIHISPFHIHLHGFGYFPRPACTLYIKLKEDKEFAKMAQCIKGFSSSILKSVKGYPPRFTKKAHLTIAKGIFDHEFMSAWPNWEDKKYECSTYADHMLLLRRPLNNVYNKYEIIGKYPFLAKEHLNVQLSLF